MSRTPRRSVLLATAVVVLCLPLISRPAVAAVDTSAGASSSDAARTEVDGTPVSAVAATGIGIAQRGGGQGYWTAERMRQAVENTAAADRVAAAAPPSAAMPAASTSPAPRAPERPKEARSYPPAAATIPSTVVPAGGSTQVSASITTGKLFYTDPWDGQGWTCTASTLNSGSRRLVSTAGHCVHGGRGRFWMQNVMFAPYYHNGLSPFGQFYAKYQTTFVGWVNDSNPNYDIAMITMWEPVVDVVGGNGLIWNWAPPEVPVTVFGYPYAPPRYDGASMWACQGGTRQTWYPFDSLMEIGCGFPTGASGGPWLMFYNDTTMVGYLNGITALLDREDGWNKSRYFDDKIGNMFAQVANRT